MSMGKRKKGGGVRAMVFAVAVVVVVGMEAPCADGWKPVLHRVGGERQGWKPDVNYTNWTTHETFYVGDWLYFGFDKHLYDVLQVNNTSYDKCEEKDFIKNVTRGGRDVFNLTDSNPFYFICGRGYCFHGMKLAVHVISIPPPPPPSSVSTIKNANTASERPQVLGAAAGYLITCLMLLLIFLNVNLW